MQTWTKIRFLLISLLLTPGVVFGTTNSNCIKDIEQNADFVFDYTYNSKSLFYDTYSEYTKQLLNNTNLLNKYKTGGEVYTAEFNKIVTQCEQIVKKDNDSAMCGRYNTNSCETGQKFEKCAKKYCECHADLELKTKLPQLYKEDAKKAICENTDNSSETPNDTQKQPDIKGQEEQENNSQIYYAQPAVMPQYPSDTTDNVPPPGTTVSDPNLTKSQGNATSPIQSTKKISGTVVDEKDDPVGGAIITQKQTGTIDATTDANGNFQFTISDNADSFIVMLTGYKTVTQNVQDCTNSCTIRLTPEPLQAEEVVVAVPVDCNDPGRLDRLHATEANKTQAKTCVPTKCKEYYELNDDKTKYESINGTNCYDTQKHEIAGTWNCSTDTNNNNTSCSCANIQCAEGYKLNNTNKGDRCVSIAGSCTPDDPNAKSGHREIKNEQEICVVDSCKKYYEVKDGKCVLSNEHSAKELEKKSDNVNKLRDREQTLANRLTSGVSMGATGIGGMMLGQSLTEQNADKDAEQDMAAYLATFRCEYAGGKSVPGGTNGVQLPADKLFDLYQEYVTLADELKEMKSQLGLKPGIESEVVLDKSNIGLYDDTATGKTNGTYASVARALSDPNSADAQKWNEQKEKTDKNLKIGAGLAIGGVAVGAIGNILTNHVDWDKIKDKTNNSKENKDKIQTLKDKLKAAGMTNVDKLNLNKLDFSEFDIASMDFDSIKEKLNGQDATKLLKTGNAAELRESFESLGQEQ